MRRKYRDAEAARGFIVFNTEPSMMRSRALTLRLFRNTALLTPLDAKLRRRAREDAGAAS